MIVAKSLNYSGSRYVKDENSDIIQVDADLVTLFTCLKGRVRFGAGTTGKQEVYIKVQRQGQRGLLLQYL